MYCIYRACVYPIFVFIYKLYNELWEYKQRRHHVAINPSLWQYACWLGEVLDFLEVLAPSTKLQHVLYLVPEVMHFFSTNPVLSSTVHDIYIYIYIYI